MPGLALHGYTYSVMLCGFNYIQRRNRDRKKDKAVEIEDYIKKDPTMYLQYARSPIISIFYILVQLST